MAENERIKYDLVNSMNLHVRKEEALHLLQQVGHETFQDAMKGHWQIGADGKVTPESICWFFCWASTGMGSFNTAETCRIKFKQIFDKTYEWFDGNIGLNFARKFRYHKPRRISL